MTRDQLTTDQRMLVLDGGMGKHLERVGAPFRQPEWSALALIEDPAAVKAAHQAFIASGAQVVTVNSYAVVPFHLGEERFAERGRELAALAGRLAREAVDEADRDVLVAGSLPPLFGSYEPNNFDAQRAPAMYAMLVEAMADHVDFWIGETVSSVAEAVAIADAVESGPGPSELWISMTVPDDHQRSTVPLRSGESIGAAVDAVARRCSAMLFNCSSPEAITIALAELASLLGASHPAVRFGAYANAFVPPPEEYSANEVLLAARDELTPDRYATMVAEWVGLGASIVGGCCQIHTEHIEVLARRFGT